MNVVIQLHRSGFVILKLLLRILYALFEKLLLFFIIKEVFFRLLIIALIGSFKVGNILFHRKLIVPELF